MTDRQTSSPIANNSSINKRSSSNFRSNVPQRVHRWSRNRKRLRPGVQAHLEIVSRVRPLLANLVLQWERAKSFSHRIWGKARITDLMMMTATNYLARPEPCLSTRSPSHLARCPPHTDKTAASSSSEPWNRLKTRRHPPIIAMQILSTSRSRIVTCLLITQVARRV